MAYYVKPKYQMDEEQEPAGAPVEPAQAPGPIPKTPGQGTEIPNSQPSNSNVSANQSKGTRSAGNFTNLQRYLEMNPMGQYAKGVENLGAGIQGKANEAFGTATNKFTSWQNSPEYLKWKQQQASLENPGYQELIWQKVKESAWNPYPGKPTPPKNAPVQTGPVESTSIVQQLPNFGPVAGSSGMSEATLRDMITNNPELMPADIAWSMPSELTDQAAAFNAPNKTGRFGLAQQMAGKDAQGYNSGMEGLDTALFGASPEVMNAAKTQSESFKGLDKSLMDKASGMNKIIADARARELSNAEKAKNFLTDKYNEGLKREFPYQGPETEGQDVSTDLPVYKKLAELLGLDPNAFKTAQYVKPIPPIDQTEADKAENDEIKRTKGKPKLREKLIQIEQSKKQTSRKD